MFFLRDESGGVHVDGGEGLFFMSPDDAKAKLQGLKGVDGVKVKNAQYRVFKSVTLLTVKYQVLVTSEANF